MGSSGVFHALIWPNRASVPLCCGAIYSGLLGPRVRKRRRRPPFYERFRLYTVSLIDTYFGIASVTARFGSGAEFAANPYYRGRIQAIAASAAGFIRSSEELQTSV